MFIYHKTTSEKSFRETCVNELPYAFDAASGVQSVGNADGYIVARKSIPLSMAIDAPGEWHKIPGVDNWECKQVAEFEHEAMVRQDFLGDGFWVVIGDSRLLIPRAVYWSGMENAEASLPRYDKLGDDGTWTKGDIFKKYDSLWKATGEVLGIFTGSDTVPDTSREIDICVEAIKTNYYMGAIECSIANLLSSQFRMPIFAALIDVNGFHEIKKKQADAGLSSTLGV